METITAGEVGIEMTGTIRASGASKKTSETSACAAAEVTSFTNPCLNTATVNSTQSLSIESYTTPVALDAALPGGWVAHKMEDGQYYYEEVSSGLTQWEKPASSSLPSRGGGGH